MPIICWYIGLEHIAKPLRCLALLSLIRLLYLLLVENVWMSDSYNAARCKLRQAEETSALETDRDDDPGLSRRKKRVQLYSSENELSPEKLAQKGRIEVQKKGKKALMPLPPVPPAPVIG